MPEFYLSKDLTIKAGTRLYAPTNPAHLTKAPVEYAHGVVIAKDMPEHAQEGLTHFQIPLEEAKKAGLVEERSE